MNPVAEIDRNFEDATDHGSVGTASVDPVCGMIVNAKSAAGSYEYEGRTYYFCSSHCLNEFREDPERFVKESTKMNATHLVAVEPRKKPSEAGYTCPMHPEVKQDRP